MMRNLCKEYGWAPVIWKPIVLVLALLLSGCADELELVGGVIVQERIKYNDTKARGLVVALCDMSVGAKNRALSEADKERVEGLCGGEQERPITMEALLFELGKMLGGFEARE